MVFSGSSAGSNNSVTISGSGNDIWDYRDAFHFHYKTLDRDGSLVARITSQENSNPWAKSACKDSNLSMLETVSI